MSKAKDTETDQLGPSGQRASGRVDPRLLPRRFVIVSNRLPYRLDLDPDNKVSLKRGVGGLVTALDPILRLTGGTWVGWSGTHKDLPQKITLPRETDEAKPYSLRTIKLTAKEVENYYLGYSNRCLWPLFHYFQEHCHFSHDEWKTYKDVNRRFTDAILAEYESEDLIWVQDYHLMLVPSMLRAEIPDARIGFFLHIPFPSNDVYELAPQARELLEGLLGADLVGFHINSYARNFITAVARLTDHRFLPENMEARIEGRQVKVAALPISIDFDQFARSASADHMLPRVREIRNSYRADILAVGVDRLDYTKGILERLGAIELMLDRHPELQGKFTYIQISEPSRAKVEAYRELRENIERMVGHINGRFGGRGCIPIDYRYEGLPHTDLVAYYRAADVALVTPLRDGMNLVAKEYVASRVDNSGALVLSRFTGAAAELVDAVLVNPYDPETTAEQIYEAIRMPAAEQQQRMLRMRQVVSRNDIYWWLERFLRDLP